MQPSREKITVSWDDVNSPQIDAKLRQQQSAARQGSIISPALQMDAHQLKAQQRTSIWYNTVFAMSFFGFLGGLVAWGAFVLLFVLSRSQYMEELKSAQDSWEAVVSQKDRLSAGLTTKERFAMVVDDIESRAAANPYFKILRDDRLTTPQKNQALERQHTASITKAFIGKVLAYGLVGMLIALALGLAEPIIDRNFHGALVNGAVGAMLGLFGGIIVSLFVDQLHRALGGAEDATLTSFQQLVANAIKYGVIGLFLMIGPGIIMRNMRKMTVGLAGGLIGGLVGGLVFSPVARLSGSELASHAVATISIGVLAGMATGLIENAAKTGWLKVIQGLIAGKQFILYRATTFIGSSPDCHVYLFKDPKVGRRHAAIHIVAGGFDLEDLPLGTPTFVNGRPVERHRLRTGDQVQVGSTVFTFQEKTRTK